MTFAIGGIGFWVAAYLEFRGEPPSSTKFFGAIIVVAGLVSTLLGGWAGDRLRKTYAGSYFLVSGVGMILAFPLFVAMLFTPFPTAWLLMFGSVFFMFLNTGPSNTALANVSLPKVRATPFALNILVIHALGDAAAFPSIGFIPGHTHHNRLSFRSGMMLLSGIILAGMKYLWRYGAVETRRRRKKNSRSVPPPAAKNATRDCVAFLRTDRGTIKRPT
jgi:MFS family permease